MKICQEEDDFGSVKWVKENPGELVQHTIYHLKNKRHYTEGTHSYYK